MGAASDGCVPLETLRQVAASLDGAGRPFTLIVDVENTLVPYRSSEVGATALLDEALCGLDDLLQLRCVVFLSNSRAQFPVGTGGRLTRVVSISRARKPWTSKSTLNRIAGEAPIAAVCGDQPLTDGVLAWRLNVEYFQMLITREGEPLWPRLIRLLGTPVFSLLQIARPRPSLSEEN